MGVFLSLSLSLSFSLSHTYLINGMKSRQISAKSVCLSLSLSLSLPHSLSLTSTHVETVCVYPSPASSMLSSTFDLCFVSIDVWPFPVHLCVLYNRYDSRGFSHSHSHIIIAFDPSHFISDLILSIPLCNRYGPRGFSHSHSQIIIAFDAFHFIWGGYD